MSEPIYVHFPQTNNHVMSKTSGLVFMSISHVLMFLTSNFSLHVFLCDRPPSTYVCSYSSLQVSQQLFCNAEKDKKGSASFLLLHFNSHIYNSLIQRPGLFTIIVCTVPFRMKHGKAFSDHLHPGFRIWCYSKSELTSFYCRHKSRSCNMAQYLSSLLYFCPDGACRAVPTRQAGVVMVTSRRLKKRNDRFGLF